MVRFSSIEYHRKSIGFFGRRCAHHFPFDWFDWPFYFVSLSLYTFTSICQGTLAASDKRAILPYIIRFPSTILWFIIRQAVLAQRSPAHKVASYIILKFPQSPVKKSAPTSANYHLLCLCTTPWQHQVDRIISPTLCVCSILHLPTAHIKSINQQLHPSGMRILFKCLSGAICWHYPGRQRDFYKNSQMFHF